MKKKKPESPYTMRTVQSAKVQGIKIYLKRYETKPIFMRQPQEYRVLYHLVTSSAKFNRKFTSAELARTCFAQLIEFEKSKQSFTMICKECIFYHERKCLWTNRVMFWFDGYDCKHANSGELNKIKASEYVGLSTEMALKVLENLIKLFGI